MPVDYKNWAADATPERVTSPLPFRGSPPLASLEGRYDKHAERKLSHEKPTTAIERESDGNVSASLSCTNTFARAVFARHTAGGSCHHVYGDGRAKRKFHFQSCHGQHSGWRYRDVDMGFQHSQ